MRVVHVTSVHPATDTRILYKECATLAAAGHEVHLVAPGHVGQDMELHGVRIHYVEQGSSRLHRMVVVGAQALSRALALRPDVLHLHDPELLLHATWARMRCRRVIFDMHEDLPKSLRTKHWIAKPLRVAASAAAAVMERLLLSGMEVVYAEDSYRGARPWIRNFITLHNMPIVASLAQYDRQCTHPQPRLHREHHTVPRLPDHAGSPGRTSVAWRCRCA
ncbi:MAG: glycosyltransferase [bacterium]|nr:glycosyltransferase [bacterium]